jgi:hypothetical protein
MADRPLRTLSLVVALAAAAISSWAMTVGVAPAEGGAYAPSPAGQGSPIGYLVSGCLSAIFDAGFIATDASVSRTDRPSWGPSNYGLAEAREGMVDYVVALYVEWAPSAFHKGASIPILVFYRLVKVGDGTVELEGSVPGPADSEDASSHEARTASQAGAAAAAPCMRTLAALAKGGER